MDWLYLGIIFGLVLLVVYVMTRPAVVIDEDNEKSYHDYLVDNIIDYRFYYPYSYWYRYSPSAPFGYRAPYFYRTGGTPYRYRRGGRWGGHRRVPLDVRGSRLGGRRSLARDGMRGGRATRG